MTLFTLLPGGSGGRIECILCNKRYSSIARLTVAGWNNIREEHDHDAELLDRTPGTVEDAASMLGRNYRLTGTAEAIRAS